MLHFIESILFYSIKDKKFQKDPPRPLNGFPQPDEARADSSLRFTELELVEIL